MFFEKVLKGSSTSVWIRNFHLAFFSVFLALAGVFSQPKEIEQVQTYGFFAGYSGVVWTLVAISGGGGLLVAAVVKYADNILKALRPPVCRRRLSLARSSSGSRFSLFVGGTALLFTLCSCTAICSESTVLYRPPAFQCWRRRQCIEAATAAHTLPSFRSG